MRTIYGFFLYITICIYYSTANNVYKTLIYGELFKGFIVITPLDTNENEYLISFEIHQEQGGETWALHQGSCPYEQSKMLNNCKRAKKSPHLFREMPLTQTKLTAEQLMGHTIVVSRPKSIVLACATIVFPDQSLMRATFHKDSVDGHVHILKLKDKIRLMPDLRYNEKYSKEEPPTSQDVYQWGFVKNCEDVSSNSTETGNYSNNEIGIDSRNVITIEKVPENNSNQEYLMLYKAELPFACSKIKDVEPRNLKAQQFILSQSHPFEALHATNLSDPKNLAEKLFIRDDCLDRSSEQIYLKYSENYYPEASIFGSESILLKALADQDKCDVLRPYQYSMPSTTSVFVHPIIGRITLVDDGDSIRATGELKQTFDEQSLRATLMITKEPLKGATCPAYVQMDCKNTDKCHTIEDVALIVGKNEAKTTLYGSFPWFNISASNAVVLDLLWTKACANLTYLPYGSIFASATIKKFSPVSAPNVASIVALEYPVHQYTEILINKRRPVSSIELHSRPIDNTVTSGPPCGEQTLGPSINASWLTEIKPLMESEENDTSVILPSNLITGPESLLGNSVLLTGEKQIACGDFELRGVKTILLAKFFNPFEGYVKLTQNFAENWSMGLPTEIRYEINEVGNNDENPVKIPLDWDIVDSEGMTCKSAIRYNPLQVNESLCNPNNMEMCSFGSGSTRAGPFVLNTRKHFVVKNLPLAGPFSVNNKTFRIRKDNSTYACEKLTLMNAATFRWVVLTERNLSSMQNELSNRLNISNYQIEVDYTRELFKSRCSIYRITIYETDEHIEKILKEFDVESRKFRDDSIIDCSGTIKSGKDNPNAKVLETKVSGSSNLHVSAQLFLISIVSISFSYLN